MSLSGITSNEKLHDLAAKCYKEQACWILNGFWSRFELEAELFWDYVHNFAELDLEKGADGNELDEFNAHRFLEKRDETLTVRAMRETLINELGVERVKGVTKYIPLIHYVMYKYKLGIDDVANAKQGGDPAELEEATRLFNDAMAKLDAALAAEAPFKAAQEELQAALDELHAQEKAFSDRTEDLKRKSEEGGIVSRNRAKNELKQHLGTDPLPLRRAKLNTEAAERKADKARAPFLAAREAAEEAVAEAKAFFEEVKAKGGAAYGSLWWMDRELAEKQRFMPGKM